MSRTLILEDDSNRPWVTLGELETRLDAWMVRDSIELTKPEKDQVKAILQTDNDIILAVRNGQYNGVIEVRRAERRILRQLAAQAEA